MRNLAISNLLLSLKVELRSSLTIGAADDAALYMLMWNQQAWLASEYAWPFLQDRWTANVAAGSRFVAFPAAGESSGRAMNMERPIRAFTKYGEIWHKLDVGIGPAEFNQSDPADSTLDPIQKWQLTAGNQFEVWPSPATGQTVMFEAECALQTWLLPTKSGSVKDDWNPLATCDLDSDLIVLFSAAERLKGLNSPEADSKLVRAQLRLRRLGAVVPREDRVLVLGANQRDERLEVRTVPLVLIK